MQNTVSLTDKGESRLAVQLEAFRIFMKRLWASPSARIGGFIVIITIAIGVGVPLLDTGYDAIRDSNLRARYAEPDCLIGWADSRISSDPEVVPISLSEMSCDHPFGADKNGRSVLRRVGHGFSVSLRSAVIAVVISPYQQVQQPD